MGRVADIIGGGTPSTKTNEYWNGNIDWYSPVEIGESIYVSGSKNKITTIGLKKSSAKILPVGTVLFTSRAGIGNTAILAREGTTNQGFQSIVPHRDKLDSYFIFSRTNELKQYGEKNGAGSTFVEVSGKQMAKMPILIPIIEEQQKIGSFFKKIDNLITLHQRKLDALEQVKEGFLSELYPLNGREIPNLRFTNYEDKWLERKLKDMGERYNGLTGKTRKDFGFGEADYITYLNVFNNPITSENQVGKINIDDRQNQVKFGDIFFTVSSETPNEVGMSSVWTGYKNNVYLNSFCFGFRPKINLNPYFSAYMFRSPGFRKKVTLLAQGISRYNISKEKVMELNVRTPSIEEQDLIGNKIKCLEQIILMQKKKLEKITNMKKYLLQNLFV